MARPVDILVEHWLTTKGKRRKSAVLLGDKEFPFWWDAWTLDDQDFVYGDLKPGEAVFRPARMAKVVLRKAAHEDGSRMFADIELVKLTNMLNPDVIKAMALAIVADLHADNAVAGAGREDDEGPKAPTAPGSTSTM